VIKILIEIVGLFGSIIFPTFTYCLKKSSGPFEIFDAPNSKNKLAWLSKTFTDYLLVSSFKQRKWCLQN